jgi:hypothetical protein
MKKPNWFSRLAPAIFFCAVLAGLLFHVGVWEAAAACKDPYDPNNYALCKDCAGSCSNGTMTGCDPDINNDSSVTTTDLQAVLMCVRLKCNPALAKYACYDLNKDGKINMTDYDIVRRCLGCCSTPSPIK